MKKVNSVKAIWAACAIFALNAMSFTASAVDADAAKGLARQNSCFKCHSVDKEKDGPTFVKVAAKYKGKPDAEQQLMHHLTSGEKARFPDGHTEEHKTIKTSDQAELKNLVEWILSQ